MFKNTFYLNRDVDVARRDFTEAELRKYGFPVNRFSAIESDLQKYVLQPLDSLNINRPQASCLISHLEIIRLHGSEDLLVLEDDVDFSTIPKWPVTISEIADSVPESVGIVQLTYFPTRGTLGPVRWVPGTFSTAAYLIKKEYAKHLVETGFKDGIWDLNKLKSAYGQKLADSVLYSSTNTMSLVMFGIRNEKSSILPNATYHDEVAKWTIELWDTHSISREQLLQQIRGFR